MKTLKQIIAEAKDKEPYPITKHGDAIHKDHDYDEDKDPRTKEEIENAGPHPLVKKRMEDAFAGVEHERYVPKGRESERDPKIPVVQYRKKRVAKRKKKST